MLNFCTYLSVYFSYAEQDEPKRANIPVRKNMKEQLMEKKSHKEKSQ